MQISTSARRKGFRLLAVFGALGVAVAAASTFVDTVTPAEAASFVQQPDMQVAVFMVPLTLLVLLMIFEVARVCLRGALPVQAPRAPRPTDWAEARDAA
ncbi:hypothetical protein [Devosia sediminis]|uniref:Uncharacterized protein n=1 Tax=Devosia sediminis TaxID=2798801 RepID=A0A934ISJ1_9HYPH|nr:hypothetical protein [Devosia sediminis]MBJ3783517.1 hypothetical protein [Devosia sediminis]